jgi:phosphonate transport system substrate-binding protein
MMRDVRLTKYASKAMIGLLAWVVSFSASGSCLGDQTAASSLKVYVVPQMTATEVYVRWAPLLEELGHRTKQCFELNVPSNIPQFEADLNDGLPDFAYMNPYHAVMPWRENQYVPLIASSEPIFGLLSVRRDSKVQNLQQLSGESVAFPAPNAFAASLLIRATLALEGVVYKPVYVKTHSNVYRLSYGAMSRRVAVSKAR